MTNREAARNRIEFERMTREARIAPIEFSQVNWDALLRAALSAAIVVVLIAVLVPGDWFNRQNVLGATVQMERLAKTLESAKAIAPDTAGEISRLMQRPQFDCGQTDCDATLTLRNRTARLRLKILLDRNLTAEATSPP